MSVTQYLFSPPPPLPPSLLINFTLAVGPVQIRTTSSRVQNFIGVCVPTIAYRYGMTRSVGRWKRKVKKSVHTVRVFRLHEVVYGIPGFTGIHRDVSLPESYYL